MALSLTAAMRYDAASIPEYSLILQTTVRSKSGLGKHLATISLSYHRILLASIRNLARFPCPRCLIPKDRVHNMGKRRDIAQRETLVRVDDVDHRHRVTVARDLIYQKNYAVDSAAVKRILHKDSTVPTAVCICPLSAMAAALIFFSRTHFLASWRYLVCANFVCLPWISCTRSSSTSGKHFLFTSCVFWTA
jgi:hypothetical protein